ncbi:hypothetical protein GBAR_LOCUS20794 [Geodia barretti]|uniref:Secreted protein n=1 Tax=Geodia barretti TaxID=519541 RepID=A0AA35SW19_GEOBA|nr:hypothetical protein GBAR_LOCUS20794 [Geodia barretti]
MQSACVVVCTLFLFNGTSDVPAFTGCRGDVLRFLRFNNQVQTCHCETQGALNDKLPAQNDC